ncbi:MAG TPA: polysaccharide lyase [Thermoanaerobaculia bacterium]|nr:polysaccharide lyase [Thermoanaerobaculia bacterium]
MPWFEGDFDSGDLSAWGLDLARPESIEIVDRPTRAGPGAARLTLAPGDRAASKERAELRLRDHDLERRHAGQGQEVWYAWSLWLPEELADPTPGQFQMLAQWHHRPVPREDRKSFFVVGAPPLALHLQPSPGGSELVLLGRSAARREPRVIAERVVARQAWVDLLFRIRWSTGADGEVEAWLDGHPWTDGVVRGANLYNAIGNYLRLGLYRRRGGEGTDRIYVDEVRIGPTRTSVAP